MKLYVGIDLHSNNSYVAILNEIEMVIYQKRVANDEKLIIKELAPYKEQITGIVIESTYNWYWLVDALQEAGYIVHLANTTAIETYKGLKYTDDKTDALWLAKLLRLGILATGYIYPKELRGLRELLRRRMKLVQEQTTNLVGLQSLMNRYHNIKINVDKIKRGKGKEEEILSHVKDEDVYIAAKSQLIIVRCLQEQIEHIEKKILTKIKDTQRFKILDSVPGIGPILAMTIMLETGVIHRFKQVGNYSSYCRCVESKRISNGKKKGENNRKNGNPYLGWAFIEAANFAIRFNKHIKKYYQRKLAKTKRVVALKTVANKLSRACYYMLREGVAFDMTKAFG
jgi:transposase